MRLNRILLAFGAALVLLLPTSGFAETSSQSAARPGRLVSVIERNKTVDTITVRYGYAFAGGLSGLGIYDVSPPSHPRFVTRLTGWVHDIAIRGDYAYVSNGNSENSSVSVLDIDGPVTAIAWIDPPRVPNVPDSPFPPQLSFIGPVAVRGSLLYTTNQDFVNPWEIYQGLSIYSIRNPRHPQLLGRVRLHDSTSINRLVLRGDYAYVGGLTGLETVNVDNPRNPRRSSFRKSPSRDLAVNGKVLFSGNPVSGGTVRVYSLARPNRPKYLGTIWGPADLAATDDLAVAHPKGKRDYLLVAWNTTPADFMWVHVYDITPPMRLGKHSLLRDRGRLRGITSNRVNDMTAVGPVVYVAQGYEGVRMVKVNWRRLR